MTGAVHQKVFLKSQNNSIINFHYLQKKLILWIIIITFQLSKYMNGFLYYLKFIIFFSYYGNTVSTRISATFGNFFYLQDMGRCIMRYRSCVVDNLKIHFHPQSHGHCHVNLSRMGFVVYKQSLSQKKQSLLPKQCFQKDLYSGSDFERLFYRKSQILTRRI